ncbi:hypothetical protein [Polaromonas sp.]|uniref:hypothetical protein n=1 Tax=Polaromonas sp. TaxID=1869339 RepID=UPI0032661B9E
MDQTTQRIFFFIHLAGRFRHVAARFFIWFFALASFVSVAQAQESMALSAEVQQAASEIAAELGSRCPVAPAGDVPAYTACRQALFTSSKLRAHLSGIVLWGRQDKRPNASLRQTNLTQFAPDVWTSMYAPLFMFNGKHTVEWVPEEKMFLVRLEAAFRNRLPPGQFPYPFWHDEAKWSMYENANSFMLWFHPQSASIRAAQFTDRAPNAMLQPVQVVKHEKYAGPWLWTDDKGRTQPAVTLFDGVYRADNPNLAAMDRQYRDLALQMRESQCTSCHVPNNPDKMSRLVLLSTPAHAAGEVDRLIKAVREDRMPMDDFRISYALSDENKKWLLESAFAFKATVEAAQDWEKQAAKKSVAIRGLDGVAPARSEASVVSTSDVQSGTDPKKVIK